MYLINKRVVIKDINKNYNNTKGLIKRAFSIQTSFLLPRLASVRRKKHFSSKKAKKLRFLARKKLQAWRSLGLKHPKKRKRVWYKKAYNLLYKKVSRRKKLLRKFSKRKNKKPRKKFAGGRRRWRRWRAIPWKFRFRQWKFYTRNLWRNRLRSGGLWISRHMLSYRMYRRVHQPYRIRKPWKEKNNSWLNRYRFTQRPRSLLTRRTRLVSRQVNFRVFSSIYGLPTTKKVVERSKHFKRIYFKNISQRNNTLNWFESRLDIMLFRLHLAPSIRSARVLINTGYTFVNNDKVLNIGYRTQPWDIIEIAPHNYVHSLRYWYFRRRYQRYVFKHKSTRFSTNNQKHLDSGFGFSIRFVNEVTMPRKGIDRINAKEFERLMLWV